MSTDRSADSFQTAPEIAAETQAARLLYSPPRERAKMGFKIGGYIEPRPLDELEDKRGSPPQTPTPAANAPPSYDSVMAQEQAQKRMIGGLLLQTSQFFGVRPFKAPYDCDGSICRRRRFRDRISPVAFTLCMGNVIVIMNHFRLHLISFKDTTVSASLFSSEQAEMIMKTVDSILPFVCVLGMIFTSYHMHNLLTRLTDAHFSVLQVKCTGQVNFWRYTLYGINFFFVLGAVFELPQNFMKEMATVQPGMKPEMMPLADMDLLSKILYAVDRYYYPIINFGVVKIPQMFIMMISIRIALMFRHTHTIIRNRFLSKAVLENYFSQFIEIVKIQQMLECCFNKLILAIVTTSVVKIIFTSYVTVKELSETQTTGVMSLFVPETEGAGQGIPRFLYMLNSTCSVFSLALNIVWSVVFIVPCIWCNEESRIGLRILTNQIVPDEAKNVKDQIIQKLIDPTWGVTIGNFAIADRALAVSIFSLVFSIVVVWLQMASVN